LKAAYLIKQREDLLALDTSMHTGGGEEDGSEGDDGDETL